MRFPKTNLGKNMSEIVIDRKRIEIDGVKCTVDKVDMVKGQLRKAFITPSSGEKVQTVVKFQGELGRPLLQNLIITDDGTLANVWYRESKSAPAALQARVGAFVTAISVKENDFSDCYQRLVDGIADYYGLLADDPLRNHMLMTRQVFLKKNNLTVVKVCFQQVTRKEATPA